MFAKPVKKPAAAVSSSKSKNLNKPKTVSVKSGVKAANVKRSKTEPLEPRPPPRPDPSYSLYSTDSEDQVVTAFTDMDKCEKILTHLRSKQKGQTKVKKKKKATGSPQPKALNDIPAGSNVNVDPNTGLPLGAVEYLRQLHAQELTSNPVFNYRLASSTPDPDKYLMDQSGSRSQGQYNNVSHDVPERDISTVSTVPPTSNHLQNMAEMVEIYKALELKKYQQMKEATAMAELEKMQSRLSGNNPAIRGRGHNVSDPQHASVASSLHKTHGEQNGIISMDGESALASDEKSGGFIGGGSLGFQLSEGRPSYNSDSLQPGGYHSGMSAFQAPGYQQVGQGRRSSPTAFQPFIGRDSAGPLPPGWQSNAGPQQRVEGLAPGSGQFLANLCSSSVVEPLQLSQQSEKSDVPVRDKEQQFSDRTEQSATSQATDYAIISRRVQGTQDQQGAGQTSQDTGQSGSGICHEVAFERQNGLYQIHQVPASNTDKSQDNTGYAVDHIHEAPERDVNYKLAQKSDQASTQAVSEEGTFTMETKQAGAQSCSDSSAASTPRAQNVSNSGSTGGRLVFIPNDSSSQNVVGYFPGIPVLPGLNQPWTVVPDSSASGPPAPGSMTSSAVPQGPSTSQLSGPGNQPESGNNFTGYHSNQYAQMVAAGDVGSRKLRYLMKELKECGKVSKDVEIGRLVKEVDEVINSIPQLALTFNLQTEVDLAIQPLRSENSQLRRKMRLITQQLKEKEEAPKDINFEILHLQTSNETLQKSLREEKNVKTRLAAEVQFVLGEIHKMKVEKSKLISDMSERETKELKFRQETLLETQKLRHDIEMFKKDKDVTESRMDAAEKENHILQVTLTQRDAEITRQQSVIETMKESISDLLRELDQSRAAERKFDHDNSYGLNRLLQIVQEDDPSFARENKKTKQTSRKRSKTPERKNLNISSFSSSSTPRLTKAALAFHDRKHPTRGNVFNTQTRPGPASESELDTLVELQRKERYVSATKKNEPATRRRTSSSSPVRFRGETTEELHEFVTRNSPAFRDIGTRPFDRVRYGRETERKDRMRKELRVDGTDMNSVVTRQMASRPQQADESVPNWRATQYVGTGRQGTAVEQSVVSVEQSRYSVTDYFRKYPQSAGTSQTLNQKGKTHERGSSADNFTTSSPVKSSLHFRTSSEIEDKSTTLGNTSPTRNIKQRTLFKGINCDQTISAIPDDDNVSSVSMDTVTTANSVDDRRFRNGIATLDANIAKLQQALQKTKSMLT